MAESIDNLDELCINTIRMLSIDAVQKANSGHPGMPMGAATMAYSLWTRHLRHNLSNPAWPDRDRFVLSAGLPVIDRNALAPASGLKQGAYVLADVSGSLPEVILIATGSEVSMALDAHERLTTEGIRSRVVPMPCWELFDAQPPSYRDAVLPPSVRARVSIEAASPLGWERYVGWEGAIVGIDHFGASAPGPLVMREFGFRPENIVETARTLLKRSAGS